MKWSQLCRVVILRYISTTMCTTQVTLNSGHVFQWLRDNRQPHLSDIKYKSRMPNCVVPSLLIHFRSILKVWLTFLKICFKSSEHFMNLFHVVNIFSSINKAFVVTRKIILLIYINTVHGVDDIIFCNTFIIRFIRVIVSPIIFIIWIRVIVLNFVVISIIIMY